MHNLSDCYQEEDSKCLSRCDKPSLVILKCGVPNSVIFPGTPGVATTNTSTIAYVNLDTLDFCNACKSFEFTSNIIVPATTASATLSFQIFKICACQTQQQPIGPSWSYQASASTSDAFTFLVCDCNNCSNECCTYIVQVTATVLAVTETTTTIRINNATLSVLAVDN